MKKPSAKEMQKKMETINLLDKSYNYKEDVIKINRHNNPFHELAKCILSLELMQNGSNVITEAIFLNGCRADILDLQNHEAVEVLYSESKEKFEKKLSDYPLKVRPFGAVEVIRNWVIKNQEELGIEVDAVGE